MRTLQRRLVRVAAAAAVAVIGCGGVLVGPTLAAIISDSAFADADWSATVLLTTNGATDTAAQVTTGGNPGAFRFMTHTMPPAVGSGPLQKTQIWVFHEYLPTSYDPAAQGAIASLDYAEDRIQEAPPFPNAMIAGRPALMQGSEVYSHDPAGGGLRI